MSLQVPELRTCGPCGGTGQHDGAGCPTCRGAGLVWGPVPAAGYPASARPPGPRRTPES